MTKMIPPVPTAAAAVMMPTPKQKIGFSIESIVGNDVSTAGGNSTPDLSGPQSPPPVERNVPGSPPQTPPATLTLIPGSPPHHLMAPPAHGLPYPHPHAQQQHLQAPHPHPHLSPAQQHVLHQHLLMQQQQHPGTPKSHQDIQELLQRLHHNAAMASGLSPLQTRLSPESEQPQMAVSLKRERSPAPPAMEQAENPAQRIQPPHTPPKSVSPQSSQPSSSPTLLISSPHATPPQQQQQQPPPNYPKPAMMHPGAAHVYMTLA